MKAAVHFGQVTRDLTIANAKSPPRHRSEDVKTEAKEVNMQVEVERATREGLLILAAFIQEKLIREKLLKLKDGILEANIDPDYCCALRLDDPDEGRPGEERLEAVGPTTQAQRDRELEALVSSIAEHLRAIGDSSNEGRDLNREVARIMRVKMQAQVNRDKDRVIRETPLILNAFIRKTQDRADDPEEQNTVSPEVVRSIVQCLLKIAQELETSHPPAEEQDPDMIVQEIRTYYRNRASRGAIKRMFKLVFKGGVYSWEHVALLFRCAAIYSERDLERTAVIKNMVIEMFAEKVAPWVVQRGGWVSSSSLASLSF
ncbi:hypothetical protein BaRGS_00022382 [Batillaria attramentaria]|uniref:Uncharacterized protein n=1 Tax=Batillaria attramentaria TaxID=370345 RepID=A0ABD0KGQ9_9CAEN